MNGARTEEQHYPKKPRLVHRKTRSGLKPRPAAGKEREAPFRWSRSIFAVNAREKPSAISRHRPLHLPPNPAMLWENRHLVLSVFFSVFLRFSFPGFCDE
jgi:hypothetical protein